MRAVNLIPPEERKGQLAPLRTGAVAYLIVGGLALALLAVTASTLLERQIAGKQEELASLEQQRVEAEARAANLEPFVQFAAMKEARVQTVRSLAESRFDWERVMEELARVLPKRVWLTSMQGTVAGESDDDGAPTPSLTLEGCARSQRDVGRLVTSLEDIDGATRVLAEKGEKGSGSRAGANAGAAPAGTTPTRSSGDSDCQTRSFIAKFTAEVRFDEVAIDPSLAAPQTAPGEEESAPEGGSAPESDDAQPPDLEGDLASDGPQSSDGGAGSAEAAREQAAGSVEQADEKVQKARNLASGGSE